MRIPAFVRIGSSAVGLALAALPQVHGQSLTFSEIAAAAGVQNTCSPSVENPVLFMTGGGAAGDFNNDGWQDLFVLGGGTTPDRLFLNNGDGTFTDRAAEWGVDALHIGGTPAVGDYDRDGWLDVYVTSFGSAAQVAPGHNKLYHNVGGTHFEEVAQAAGVATNATNVGDAWGAAWGDYDLDGDLDLAVASWLLGGGNGDRLFRNNGDGTFADVTAAALGPSINDARSFAPRFTDMDGDRYPELLWVADFRTSIYFVNNRDGTFTDATASSGAGKDQNGMGNTQADFNGDGLLDWYVTSIFAPITMSWGDMLYINQGNHTFIERGAAAGVADAGWGWATVADDLDNDGDADLVVTGGFNGTGWTRPPKLFLNDGAANFESANTAAGLTHASQGRGLISFDYDNDGDQDLVFLYQADALRLYRNDLPATNHWLRIFLDHNGRSNLAPNGFGTRVWATAGGKTQVRYLDGGCNYLSQSELSVHFGLAGATQIDELRVVWATGEVSTLTNLGVDQTITIKAQTLPGDITADGRVRLDDLGVLLSAFGACAGDAGFVAAADLRPDGCITLDDLMELLSVYGTSLY